MIKQTAELGSRNLKKDATDVIDNDLQKHLNILEQNMYVSYFTKNTFLIHGVFNGSI